MKAPTQLMCWPPGNAALALTRAAAVAGIPAHAQSGPCSLAPASVLVIGDTRPLDAEIVWQALRAASGRVLFLPNHCQEWFVTVVAAVQGIEAFLIDCSTSAASVLTRVLHDVMKNTYLRHGRSGITRIVEELPLWVGLWTTHCSSSAAAIRPRVESELKAGRLYLDGRMTEDEFVMGFEGLCAKVLSLVTR